MKNEALKLEIPEDLREVLTADPKAKATWNGLTAIARRDFISWIDSAKQPETRRRRVESVPSRLASGKRRPCCYAVVPLDLNTALNACPKAKAAWKELTPDEKRDFIEWIGAEKEKDAHKRRIEKSCALLERGKRHP
jgi:uncharacterized protein YdeI (YjbR/CyaY-like superfamily)